MMYTVQPVQEFPCLYGDAQVEPPLPLTQVGVSSLVRGIRRPSTRRISPVWSVLACTGHPLSKPLQNQGSATLGNPKNFSLPHTRGHDHLAAVSFKSHTTSSTAA